MHEVLVNRLGGLSLPRKSVLRLTDRPDMTLDVYRGRKTTIQYNNNQGGGLPSPWLIPTPSGCWTSTQHHRTRNGCWTSTQHHRITRPFPDFTSFIDSYRLLVTIITYSTPELVSYIQNVHSACYYLLAASILLSKPGI